MKTTVVPAQVTTLEDRIAGSLGMSQLLLLSMPIFLGGSLYIFLPPIMHISFYKIVIITSLAFVCSSLAIRLKGKILLFWLILILRYNIRPSFYIFDKNSLSGRKKTQRTTKHEINNEEKNIDNNPFRPDPLNIADLVLLQEMIGNPGANLTFKSMKGGLHVSVTEVKG